MASYSSSLKFLLFTCALLFLFISISPTNAQKIDTKPKALVLQVIKDAKTRQYFTRFLQRTPFAIVDMVFDLGGKLMWIDCEKDYKSTSYRPARCGSAQCKLAGSDGCSQCFNPPKPGCNNNTCSTILDNSVIGLATSGEVGADILALQSTNGANPVDVVRVPRFIFSCAPHSLLEGLVNGSNGIIGLGRSPIALPWQFSSIFKFSNKFAVCLTSSTDEYKGRGAVFFGDSPYIFSPNVDASKSLTYTPLFINPVSTASAYSQGEASTEYFIGVKSIKVDEKAVALNAGLLSINETDGYGGTKLSTVNPYTVMESSIYKAVTEAFLKAAIARKLTRVAGVAPFGVCFSSKNVGSTRVGPAVPTIDLVLQSESTYWRMFGANSMVQVNNNVLCLGIVDGGVSRPQLKTSIVIGGHQLEDNLLEFDLARSRVGFSSSLLFRQTNCANFNHTWLHNG
ncbi:hypothetical protein Scep_030450 [Stephania cephalantha]|uniref:Peptidase A1 domain-containing protein n=1 Tax=Stephania cephalantha TaxID=152367 RepID=A0AAP0E7A2_9MAGN